MKSTRSQQILRIDGRDSFVEVTTDGLPIDKLYFGFVKYDKGAAKGHRVLGSINIYMNVLEAQVLARDILSGRIGKLGEYEKRRCIKENVKYAKAVFSKQGGTPAASNHGQAIARIFEIVPGSAQPWIFCVKQGDAHETPEGLIVMNDVAKALTIRVPLTDSKLKEFALAIEAAVQVWIQLRFVPAAAPAMQIAAEKRAAAVSQAKAEAAERAMAEANRRG